MALKRRNLLGGLVAAVGGAWLYDQSTDDKLSGTTAGTGAFDGILWVIDSVRPNPDRRYDRVSFESGGQLHFEDSDTLLVEGLA
jgi:hypothetical protein